MTQLARQTFAIVVALLVTAITFHETVTVPAQPAYVPVVLA